MKNKGIVIFLLLITAVIVVTFVSEYLTGRPGRSDGNPFALDIEAFKSVDPALIKYTESKNLRVNLNSPSALKIFQDTLYISGDNRILVISQSGTLCNEYIFSFQPVTFEVTAGGFYIATLDKLFKVDKSGEVITEWEVAGSAVHITAVAVAGDNLMVADAGNRKILRYNFNGEFIDAFDGKADEGALHGFIVPGPQFDLCINNDNELWVVNPGLHALENYSFEGKLRGHWSHSGVDPEGFSGCCNPGHIAFLSDGRFVTSEKGLVRIKTYRPSGELDGVVAEPLKFTDNGQAPDIAADSKNNIYALDYDRKLIRIFVPLKMEVANSTVTDI